MRQTPSALFLAAALLAAGCSSKDERAAAAAAEADAAFQRGDVWNARLAIRRATGIRDDNSDFWLLQGRIALASGDLGGAFDAYQNAINLDRANAEALRMLCRLALIARDPDRVDRYADQLLLLAPNDPVPMTAKGAASLQRGDAKAAAGFAARALANSPGDFDALMLKGRVLLTERRFAEAAATVESTLTLAGSPSGRLDLLRDIYTQSRDRPGYERTIARLAEAQQQDPFAQLTFADLLFETGRPDRARALLARAARLRPEDEKVADELLAVLERQGADAMPIDGLTRAAAGTSPGVRTAYAQYAIDRGRPDLATALLAGAGDSPNVRAVRALAAGLSGDRDGALAALDAVLEDDPSNPRALLGRARLQRAARRPAPALADARRVVADDAANVAARLLVADILMARGDDLLAQDQLREGLRSAPGDARLAARLAASLTASGRRDAAADALREATATAPLDLRVRRVRDGWCAANRAACGAAAST